MAITAETRTSIILGAVNMAGQIGEDRAAWDRRVSEGIKSLTSMLSEQSPYSRKITMLDEAKKFPATVLYVGKEKSSNRGFVVLKTKPSERNPDGIETCRTEITDGNDEAKSFASWLRGIAGHRVLVYIEMQETSKGQKVRIIQHADDLGEDRFCEDGDIEAGRARAQQDMKG